MSTIICSRRAMERVLLLKRKSSRFTSTFASNSSFSSKAQQREEEDQEQRGQRLGGTTTTSTLPSLRSRMKHFAKIVHPDILGQHFPRRANVMHESEDKERKYVLENNQNALAELNAVLDSITKEKKFPKTGVKRLKFYYVTRERSDVVASRMKKKEGEGKEEEEDEGEKEDELVLREAKFTLKTNGGDCRNVLKQSLRKLFAEVLEISTSEGGGGGGSSSSNKRSGKKSNNNSFSSSSSSLGDFTWEASDWANEGTEEEQERERFHEERERQTEEYERMVAKREREERINGSSNSSDSNSREKSSSSHASEKEMKQEQRRHEKLQQDLRNMDPLFEGIAFVPWLPENEAGKSRKLSVVKEVVPKLQKNGWNLKKESLKEVWRGQRDRAVLLEGLDGASAAAMHAILRHSEIAEKQLGPPVMNSADTFEWFD
ncbi:unnamed protein product [Bathycoccus prasinos]